MKSGQPGTDIDALLASLYRLYGQVVTALLKQRLQRRGTRESVAIAKRLIDHIEQAAASAIPRDADTIDRPAHHRDLANPRSALTETEPGITSSDRWGSSSTETSAHFTYTGAAVDIGVAEKLQAATIGHIKAALRMSRQGELVGARLRAVLAEIALETASEYMGKEEFQLGREVARRAR